MASLSDASTASLDVCGNPNHALTETRPVRRVSLKKNAIWTMLGNGFYAGTQWLQIAFVAHLGNSSELGYFALALGFCTPVFMLCNLQLRQLQATDACRQYAFGEYLALRLVTSGVASTVLIVVAFCSGSIKGALLIVAMTGYKAVESISDIYQGLLQQRERMDYVAGSFTVKGLFVLAALGLTYYWTRSLVWAVLSMLGAQLLTLIIYDLRAVTLFVPGRGRTARPKLPISAQRPIWNRITLRSLCIRALPLGIAMMLISLYASVPRFVLSKYAGSGAVGIFAAISYVSMIGGMIVTAVGTAIAPRMSEYAETDKAAFYGLLTKLVGLAGGLGACGIAITVGAGHWLLTKLYGVEYSNHGDTLLWSMGAATLSYLTSAFGFSATALGRLKAQPWVVAVSTLVLICASALLVPSYGLVGAAMATLASSSVSLCCFVLLVLRRTTYDSQ